MLEMWLALVATLAHGGRAEGAEAAVEATVAAVLSKLTTSEKARQLDIWRACDMLDNGALNLTKAGRVMTSSIHGVILFFEE